MVLDNVLAYLLGLSRLLACLSGLDNVLDLVLSRGLDYIGSRSLVVLNQWF